MKKILKKIVKNTIGVDWILYLINLKNLLVNFLVDFRLYYRHSNVFKINNLEKYEAQLILDYHSVEKGMLFADMKSGFARYRIERLHKYLKRKDIIDNIDRSQIQVAFQVMCKYYELHKQKDLDISSFYSDGQYQNYKSLLSHLYSEDFEGALDCSFENLYEKVDSEFGEFAYTRKSVRNFTGEMIASEAIENAISLAITAPSVCNRQASKVYLLEDKNKIDAALKIQGGFTGYTDNVKQLLILTNDRNYYYTVGERNQFYIDGGLFLMNLLYALHYYKIAACPANWGKLVKDEARLDKVIKIPPSEKIICMIPIGIAEEEFKVTLSKRRPVDEVLIRI